MKRAVALAFEEMRTPYASGREICVQKFGNAYQRKEIEKRMPHFKTNKMFFVNDTRFPFTQLAYVPWSFASWFVWDVFRPSPVFGVLYAVRIAFMILRTARLLCVIHANICVNATADEIETNCRANSRKYNYILGWVSTQLKRKQNNSSNNKTGGSEQSTLNCTSENETDSARKGSCWAERRWGPVPPRSLPARWMDWLTSLSEPSSSVWLLQRIL